MALFPFVGPSYVYRSKNFDVQRSVNVFPVKSETGTSKNIGGMQGTPGISTFLTFPKFPVRGGINVNGRVFWVAGNGFYEIFSDSTYILRGTLTTSTGNISIDTNGNQICVVTDPDGFIFNLTTNVFSQITDSYYLGAVTVTFIDGYFMFNKPDSQVYFLSALYDGTTGDVLDFASAEGLPDQLIAIKNVHQQGWLFGATTIQVVENTGAADFPYQTIHGSLIQYGLASPYGVCTTSNVVYWIGQDNDGNGVVWTASGYQPRRISTHAIETYLAQYSSYISNALMYSYQEEGHWFIVLRVPNMPTALVFDPELEQWHERGYWSNGAYSLPRQNSHVYAFGKHLCGDYQNGNLYEQSMDIYDDDGQPIRRLRTAPYITDDPLYYIYFKQFWLDMQTGVGSDGPPVYGGGFDAGFDSGFDIGSSLDPSTHPQICLRWTDDGYNWSSEYFTSAGKIGEYSTRALWNRLGRGRQRAFEVTYTPATPVFWIAAHVDVEKGTN